jgi:hypothetical protein
VRPLALFVLDGRGPPGLNERSAHRRDAAEQDRTGCTAGTAREWSQSSNPPAGHKAMAIAPGASEPVARPDRRHTGHPGGDPATDLLFAASGNRRHGHPPCCPRRVAPPGVTSPHGPCTAMAAPERRPPTTGGLDRHLNEAVRTRRAPPSVAVSVDGGQDSCRRRRASGQDPGAIRPRRGVETAARPAPFGR